MNPGHNCLFHKGFCMVYFGNKRENEVTLPHSAQRKHEFLVITKETSKSKKVAPKKKYALELLNHRLGQISTRSLMDVDTANVYQYIELRVYPDPFFTLCQIYSMNKNSRSKDKLKPKASFKWVLWILFHKHHQKVLQVKLLFIMIF